MTIAERIKAKTATTKEDKPAAVKKVTIKSRVVDRDMLTIDPKLQCRESMSDEVVEEYHRIIKSGVDMPPLRVVDVAGELVLVDGFTRFAAMTRANKTRVSIAVSTGTRDDAVREACSANRTHGLRRTGADIQKAVALAEATWPKMTRKELADLIGVSVASVYNHTELPTKETKPKKEKPEEKPKAEKALKVGSLVSSLSLVSQLSSGPTSDEPAEIDLVKDEHCIECGETEWELTDGGRQCTKCKKPIEENSKTKEPFLNKKPIDTAFGRLVRSVEEAGVMTELKPFLDAFSKALKDI